MHCSAFPKSCMVLPGIAVLACVCFGGQRGTAPAREPLTGMEFVRISAGSFTMGCSDDDQQCDVDERPSHRVRISKAFEMGKYEVTRAQWIAVMGGARANTNPNLPVQEVSWNDVQEFLQKLNEQQSGYRYRLPTEAEWEYAARAGRNDAYGGELNAIAWYAGNSGGDVHPVGQKKPNRWGLYDMEGNVWEWVQDWYDPYYYAKSPPQDPMGPDHGVPPTSDENSTAARVLRGGSWSGDAKVIRVSYRSWGAPEDHVLGFGFRCVREPS